jgi:hypothetical protein
MRNIIKLVLILSTIPILAAVQDNMSAGQQQAIEKAVMEAHAEMKAAAEKLDVEKLYGYVLDAIEGPIVEDGRVARTRQEAFETTKLGLQRISRLSYEYTQKHVTALSPTIALWVAHGTASATLQDGREISAPFAETTVFTLKDGKWKVLHAHRSTPNAR